MISKPKILIVEDTFIVAKSIVESLNGFGYRVIDVVDNGKKAIDMAGETKPDLILMDIKLKGKMDGIEAALIIKECFNIPVIYLTAHADDYILQRAKQTDPLGFIIKPFKKKELHTTIEMAVHKIQMDEFHQKSKEFLSKTLNSINDAVITINNKKIITFLNPLAEAMTGWSQELSNCP